MWMWHWLRCIWNTVRKGKGRCIKTILGKDWSPLARLRPEMWNSILWVCRVGLKPIFLRRSPGEEGAGREVGAGDCTPIFQGKAEEQRGQEIKEERWPGTREPRRVWNGQSEHGACGDGLKKGLCRGRDLKAVGYINASPLGP